MKKGVVFLIIFYIHNYYYSQENSITFDFKITELSVFNSSKDISTTFLKYFYTSDSTDYSKFYNKDIFCLLINEEITNNINRIKVDVNELCEDKNINKIFLNTMEHKRSQFFESKDLVDFHQIEIVGFKDEVTELTNKSKYKFDLFNLTIKFKNKTTNENHQITLYGVYHINYHWFILEPYFEIY